jgi:hypothetical protein
MFYILHNYMCIYIIIYIYLYIHIYIRIYFYIYIYIYTHTVIVSTIFLHRNRGHIMHIYIYAWFMCVVTTSLGMVHDDYIWLHSGGGWWLIASQHRFHYVSRMLHLYILCGLIIGAELQKSWGQFWPGVLYSWESWSLAKDSGEVTS